MKQLFLSAMFGLIGFSLQAQTISSELISSGGDNFANSNLQLNWSLGELQTESFVGSQYILTQGFHQETFAITKISENPFFDISIVVFPNPTKDFINLKVENNDTKGLYYVLFDLNGEKLLSGEFSDLTEQINFSEYTSGTYFIKILQNNKQVKSFQIIKK